MDPHPINESLWEDAIISDERWINGVLSMKEGDPFAPAAVALRRLLNSGIERTDLLKVLEFATYEAVFTTLTTLEHFDVFNEDGYGLHEDLLTARPGSDRL